MADSKPSDDEARACTKCGRLNDGEADVCAGCSEALDVPKSPPATLEHASQLLGRIVNGKYEVLSILGEGGMGVVYKVRHLILQNKNTFALKILHPRLCAQADFQSRFLREVEIAMELTHENIIQIRDFGLTEQNLLFYTMDFFAGESLKSVLDRDKVVQPDRVIRVAKQILQALAEAHKSGIIHRDLKPDNLLVEKVDNDIDSVRILDFGIAKVLVGDTETEEKNLTQGNVIGTPKYMSPEQASGERVDGRSDLYSLGCILYEMLTGRPPFSGKTARSILVAHLTVPPQPFEKMRTGLHVPPALEALVFKLLAKSPDERPASAEAVMDLITGKKSEPVASTEMAPAPHAQRAKWLVPAAVCALLLFLALGFSVVSLLHRTGQAEASGGSGSSGASGGWSRPTSSPGSGHGPERKLRCNICGALYTKGAKVGDMCHGEPLIEVE